jgi:peptidyl-prolyl cis-trans isomerase C
LAPVKTQFGYHVIFLDDSRVKEAPALDQIKAELKQKVQQQNVTKLLDDLKAKAKVEIVPVASASASASASAASASSSAKDTGASAPANK